MEIRPGLSALVTGGASGIGRALVLSLADKGIFVTIVDSCDDRGKDAAALAEEKLLKFHAGLGRPLALFIRCDVTNPHELEAAFGKHVETHGGLDICINSAGIATRIPFFADPSDGSTTWRRTIDVNFVAVIDSTRLAIAAMMRGKQIGAIVNVGSAAGLYPMDADPIYSGSKGGVVLFTRSLGFFKSQGIRVNALCPEFVQTELAARMDPEVVRMSGGFIPMEMVVKGAMELICDETKAGSCLWITNRKGFEYWPTPEEQDKYRIASSSSSIPEQQKQDKFLQQQKLPLDVLSTPTMLSSSISE